MKGFGVEAGSKEAGEGKSRSPETSVVANT